MIGADTEGSVFSGDTPHPYLTEGVGEDFWPETYDADAADLIVRVSDRDAMLTARQATAAEGILMGESCGTALWAALQVARDMDDPDALFVVLLPDSGRNYVGKLYNDAWLRDVGLLGADEQVTDYDWRATRPRSWSTATGDTAAGDDAQDSQRHNGNEPAWQGLVPVRDRGPGCDGARSIDR